MYFNGQGQMDIYFLFSLPLTSNDCNDDDDDDGDVVHFPSFSHKRPFEQKQLLTFQLFIFFSFLFFSFYLYILYLYLPIGIQLQNFIRLLLLLNNGYMCDTWYMQTEKLISFMKFNKLDEKISATFHTLRHTHTHTLCTFLPSVIRIT